LPNRSCGSAQAIRGGRFSEFVSPDRSGRAADELTETLGIGQPAAFCFELQFLNRPQSSGFDLLDLIAKKIDALRPIAGAGIDRVEPGTRSPPFTDKR